MQQERLYNCITEQGKECPRYAEDFTAQFQSPVNELTYRLEHMGNATYSNDIKGKNIRIPMEIWATICFAFAGIYAILAATVEPAMTGMITFMGILEIK